MARFPRSLRRCSLVLAVTAVPFACSSDGSRDGVDGGSGGSLGDEPSLGDDDLVTAPPTPNCADGVLDDDEACDDGNRESGDGCGDNCRYIEPGFICPDAGEPCRPFARCGDGLVVFPEQCDDGNVAPDDGCSPTCKVEIGFKCSGTPSTCEPTVCGDGVIEGAETCDDGNAAPFDGCSATCQAEPACTVDGCTSSCGDGLLLPPEECDDGNTTNGDGCSADCKVEADLGYECNTAPCEEVNGECVLRVPVVHRDFESSHSDFGVSCMGTNGGDEATTGLVQGTLTEGKPVATAAASDACINQLGQWYTDAGAPALVRDLVLFDNQAGGFVNRHGPDGEPWTSYEGRWCGQPGGDCMANPPQFQGCNDTPFDPTVDLCFPDCHVPGACTDCTCAARVLEVFDGTPLFFPVEDQATTERFGAKIPPQYGYDWPDESTVIPGAPDRNFFFTTEVVYWFQYDASGTARLDFTGDDDVWVFVNDRLAVDLGGVHQPVDGFVEIEASTAATYQLEDGKVYKISVFHAERKIESSSFRLTLSGFSTSRSECTAICGDGIIAAGEECDNGTEENTGGYNRCNPDCTLTGYCGDGIKQEHEECDDADPEAPVTCAGCRNIVVR